MTYSELLENRPHDKQRLDRAQERLMEKGRKEAKRQVRVQKEYEAKRDAQETRYRKLFG